jgi:hypothetical protein
LDSRGTRWGKKVKSTYIKTKTHVAEILATNIQKE